MLAQNGDRRKAQPLVQLLAIGLRGYLQARSEPHQIAWKTSIERPDRPILARSWRVRWRLATSNAGSSRWQRRGGYCCETEPKPRSSLARGPTNPARTYRC